MDITIEPVTAANWRACAALTVHPGQREFVNAVTYYLCLCNYGDTWQPLAAVRDGEVVGFCMWGIDDDRSRWIGGVVVDAARQRTGIGRAMIGALVERLAADPDCPNVALSYSPANEAARALYASLGFVETGELEDDEVVARWTRS
ncbi:N-acetyltransferase [Amorphoplanes auranticolor]|uniref:N-acetyltransferase n=1 Tax=Actinoplanes auranticolor TaxID=47988 RepID=A0A919SHE9_9ACTN|nr:GNAT family N-acetyltransferase [Actinoplanes auranticolor]GIM71078.1 N-acetyltransferase [Actinoplanes auranticolor]